jgi:hypothetical protein
MATKKKQSNYEADLKTAKKIGQEALALTNKVVKEVKAQYNKTDSATKKKIKKAAIIGALGLVGLAGTKKILSKKKC